MNRRRFLALCGAGAVSLSGCLGGGDGGGGTDEPTDDDGNDGTTDRDPNDADDDPLEVGDYADAAGGSVQVAEVVVQESYVHLTSPDSKGVSADAQYLFARVVLGEGATPEQDAFGLGVGGAETGPTEPYGHAYFDVDGEGVEGYRPDEGGGWVLFELAESLGEVTSGTLTLTVDGESVAWALPEAAVSDLRRAPPEFDLRSFGAEPEGEDVRFTVEVANVGDVPGTFRAAINESGPGYAPMTTVAVDLDAGETETWTATEDVFGEPRGTHRYNVQWAGESVYRDVEFPGGTTA